MGNQDDVMAPHNCYRCLGEDRWVAIAVTGEQWPEFCRAIGDPEWCHDVKFSDALNRLANRDELDRLVEAWTRQCRVEEVVGTLQSRGIAAGTSADLNDLVSDDSLYQRGSLVTVSHPEVSVRVGPGLPWRMSEVPSPNHQAAPLIGQDNQYVFCALLGLSEEEVAGLAQEGAIG